MMPPKDFPALAENLKALREDAKLSQQELAFRSGVSVSVIFQMEQGRKKDPKLSTLHCLADGLGMTPEDLVRELLRKRKHKGK
jgi:transcriptional regulator with XRE-family HTH domain